MKPSKKHKIIIRPENYSFTVYEGQSLLEALTRSGILLQSDCGGAGRCGKCQVRVVSAEEKADCRPDDVEQRLIPEEDLRHGIRISGSRYTRYCACHRVCRSAAGHASGGHGDQRRIDAERRRGDHSHILRHRTSF